MVNTGHPLCKLASQSRHIGKPWICLRDPASVNKVEEGIRKIWGIHVRPLHHVHTDTKSKIIYFKIKFETTLCKPLKLLIEPIIFYVINVLILTTNFSLLLRCLEINVLEYSTKKYFCIVITRISKLLFTKFVILEHLYLF